MVATQGIAAGDLDIAVAGGMESMSNCPYLLTQAREGMRMGHGQVLDSMIHDGLWCSFEQCHMGNAGEVIATEYQNRALHTGQVRGGESSPRAPGDQTGRFAAEILR